MVQIILLEHLEMVFHQYLRKLFMALSPFRKLGLQLVATFELKTKKTFLESHTVLAIRSNLLQHEEPVSTHQGDNGCHPQHLVLIYCNSHIISVIRSKLLQHEEPASTHQGDDGCYPQRLVVLIFELSALLLL